MNAFRMIFISALLTSCTGKMVLMKNDKGDIEKCAVSTGSAMLTGAWAAGRDVDRCVEQWQKAGYKKIE